MSDPREKCSDKCVRKLLCINSPRLPGIGNQHAKIMLVGESPGCFLSGTAVLTKSRSAYIEQPLHNKDLGNNKVTKDLSYHVENFSCYKFKINKFPEYFCTENHKILVRKRSEYLKNKIPKYLSKPHFLSIKSINKYIKYGHQVFVCVEKTKERQVKKDNTLSLLENKIYSKRINDYKIVDNILIDQYFAFFLGNYLGDGGCNYRNGYVKITSSVGFKEKYISILINAFKRLGLAPVIRRNGKYIDVVVHSRTLVEYFSKWFGKNTYEKRVPKFIFDLPQSLIRAFLFGWYIADGSHQKDISKGQSITAVSELAIWDGVTLGLNCGVLLGVRKERSRRPNEKDCFKLVFDSKSMEKLKWPVLINPIKSPNYGEDENYFYIRINQIEKFNYTGRVYDKATEKHTYSIPFVVHNSTEDENGTPFVGASGKVLNELLADVGIDRDKIYITNAVKCATPGENEAPSKGVVKYCRNYLVKEIKFVKPNVIGALGGTALFALLNRSGITKIKNNVFYSKEFDVKVVPALHPAYILRNPSAEDDLRYGLNLIKSEASSKKTVNKATVKTKRLDAATKEQIDKVLSALEACTQFAFDLETTSLDPTKAEVLCIALSWQIGLGVTIKWDRLSEEQLVRLENILQSKKKKGGHNLKYDIQVLRTNGIIVRHNIFDCLPAMALVDENMQKKGLDALVLRYLDLGEYWTAVDDFKKEYCSEHKMLEEDFSYKYIPYDMLSTYAQCDADASFRLMVMLTKMLEHEELTDFYYKYTIPTLWTIIEIEYRGIEVDRKKLRELGKRYVKLIKKAQKTVEENEDVKRYEKIKTAKAIRVLNNKWETSKTLKTRYPVFASYEGKQLKPKDCKFNPASVKQLRELLFDLLKCKVVKETKKKAASTDKEVLNILANESNITIAKDIINHRQLTKFLSTYIVAIYKKSKGVNRVHPNYLQHVAVTGRLCVAEDTILNTNLGDFEIAKLDIGLVDLRIETHLGKWQRIIKKIYKGKEDLYEVTLNTGSIIKCTIGHRFLTAVGWRQLKELGVGSSLLVSASNKVGIIGKIKYAGIGDIWDISVENDHSYIAQGFINHNSSENPNFQNLKKNEKEFKSCLLADPGMVIVKADLAQAEFRCWAHYSNDKKMIHDIESGMDIHRKIASKVFGIPEDQVTDKQRDPAKACTFGLMFGRGTKAIAKQYGISEEQAGQVRETFFNDYPIATLWIDRQIVLARQNGYVKTWMGRKRRLPEIHSSDRMARAEAERQATNASIQGLASDMNNHFMVQNIKIARKNHIKCYPLGPIHDANFIQVEKSHVQSIIKIMKHVVRTAFPEFRCRMDLAFEVGDTLGTLEKVENVH